MRLINTHTRKFEEFFTEELPQYYILSHRWGKGEITYKDYSKVRNIDSQGHKKVNDFCDFVQKRHGHSYVWVDTCCIDKRSSAELSEAINSMWSWYKKVEICYVHLADVVYQPDLADVRYRAALAAVSPPQELVRQVMQSEWFKRGWTLQELLAPSQAIFLNDQWNVLGRKREQGDTRHTSGFLLDQAIADATGIRTSTLTQTSFWYVSIAQRKSWAAQRTTTRIEDRAYCLLGLLGINMPLLYGEGTMAFVRLQEEILKRSDDSSIFAWQSSIPSASSRTDGYSITGILAFDPSDFAAWGCVETSHTDCRPSYTMTNQGLHLQKLAKKRDIFHPHANGATTGIIEVQLDCRDSVTGESLRLYLIEERPTDRWQKITLGATTEIATKSRDFQEVALYIKS